MLVVRPIAPPSFRPAWLQLVMEGAEDPAKTQQRVAQGRCTDSHREQLAARQRGDDAALQRLRALDAANWRVPYEAIIRLAMQLRAVGVPVYVVVAPAQGDQQAIAEILASGGGVWASRDGDALVFVGPLPGGGSLSWLSLQLNGDPRFVLDGSLPALASGGAWGLARRLFYSTFQATDYHPGLRGYGPTKCAGIAVQGTGEGH